MAYSFLHAAGRPVADVQTYLEENSSSPLKFSPKSGEITRIMFPFSSVYELDANGQQVLTGKSLYAYNLKVHDLKSSATQYEMAPCLKLDSPIIDQTTGAVINSGICPFCARQEDAEKIVDFRMGMEEKKLMAQGLTGKTLDDAKEKALSNFNSERKISYAKKKLYILVAKFILNSKMEPEIDTETGLPVYTLQVMRLSNSQLDDMQKAFNSTAMMCKATGMTVEMAGGELIITYGTSTNQRNVVGEATFSATPPSSQLTASFPALMDAIQKDAAEFNWESIVNAYPEFKGMADSIAQTKADKLLKVWDRYQSELATNPNAVYAEYGISQATMPPLSTAPQNNFQGYNNQQGALPTYAPPGIPNFNGQQTQGYNPQAQQGFAQAPQQAQGYNPQTQGMATGTPQSFGAEQQTVPVQGQPMEQQTQQFAQQTPPAFNPNTANPQGQPGQFTQQTQQTQQMDAQGQPGQFAQPSDGVWSNIPTGVS